MLVKLSAVCLVTQLNHHYHYSYHYYYQLAEAKKTFFGNIFLMHTHCIYLELFAESAYVCMQLFLFCYMSMLHAYSYWIVSCRTATVGHNVQLPV
jgi:hypothetical protein